ncbi:hypothetical protein D0869_09171 [Hortaea werneckii]|uniref:NFX1-type zinc finger-containing protein 1 n=1 Tax=Hortaea werneckii TaxID=91943 RepID=A0A3M6WIU0_HORWE|nr:hypothetical protein D0869_09171 [Hortaea werneckii]
MAGKKPCHLFQLGRCKYGNGCKYAHVKDPSFKRKACINFAKGTCHRGKTCTYSHDQADIDLWGASNDQDTAANASGPSHVDNSQAMFKNWRYNIPQEVGTPTPLGINLGRFFKQAAELIDGDAGRMQEVIVLLASEGGVQRIIELLEQPLDKCHPDILPRLFNTQIICFLEIITHKHVTVSAILKPRLTTIYNIVWGEGGQQAMKLFSAVAQHLQTLRLMGQGEGSSTNTTAIHAIECALTALDKLTEVNTSAQVHDGLKRVAEAFAILFKEPMTDQVRFAVKPSQRHLRRVEQRLGLGQAIPTQSEGKQHKGERAFFTLERPGPGELNIDGVAPRYDNDHVDIRGISILPTTLEIQFAGAEYLPLTDPTQWHIGGLEGLLDRHFRLLRADTVGQLRDTAKTELARLQAPEARGPTQQNKQRTSRAFVYGNATIVDATFTSQNGIEFAISFDQPGKVQRKKKNERKDWWQNSKTLSDDALVCLLSSLGSAIFLTVVPEPKNPKKDAAKGEQQTSIHKQYDLWSNGQRAHVIVKPAQQDGIELILRELSSSGNARLSLVEFPSVLLPAFQPTLRAMQRLTETLEVPFAEVLAPVSTRDNPTREIEIQPPNYATRPGFQFDLSVVTTNGKALRFTPGRDIDGAAAELAQYSIVSSLSRSLALIQGPPGTGKSYTGVQLVKILLAHKKACNLGPILCSLERLLDEGVSNIVRIGGRSKSDRLANVNLREVAHRLDLTKTEKSERFRLTKEVEDEVTELKLILRSMSELGSQSSIEEYLREWQPQHHHQLFSNIDEEGFITVNRHQDSELQQWLNSVPWDQKKRRPVAELENADLRQMTARERRRLYRDWTAKAAHKVQEKFDRALTEYNNAKEQQDDIRTETDQRALRQANIIGITTSGLARNLDLLRRVNAKVLVCEEAGEVLESYLLTALLPSVEHAILIGDHQQLRPHVQNYDLSTESRGGAQYALDVSLFERLVQPQDILAHPLPFCRLQVQRRMHPSISQLVQETLYPNLQNAESVNPIPDVVGMRRRLFWMHHEQIEDHAGDGLKTSHTNSYEVEMTAALVKHLVHQGVYKSEEIAVITPYLGQLRLLRRKLASSFEIVLNERDDEELLKDAGNGIEGDPPSTDVPLRRPSVARGTLLNALRIATVDNFQGEEAKVVVISLVRSNRERKPGFLKTPNRINVLLSRAQHGMYIIGNSDTITGDAGSKAGSVEMWENVLDIFRTNDNFGTALELCCPRHQDTPMSVQQPSDFVRLSPEAGCNLLCDQKLSCGHACTSKCHSDMLHDAVFCSKPCYRLDQDAPIRAKRNACMVLIKDVNVQLECRHIHKSLRCFEYQDPSKVQCQVPVTWTVPGCEHQVKEPCSTDVYSDDYKCRAMCSAILPCGHLPATAKKSARRVQPSAKPVVFTVRVARHAVSLLQLSSRPSMPFALCRSLRLASLLEEVSSDIEVYFLDSKLLTSYCRCEKTLSCGCRCPSVCGEACPTSDFCQVHGSEHIESLNADLVMLCAYRDVDLDEDPCIFPPCGHVFTATSMDGTMEMAAHYEIDPLTGAFTALKSTSEPFSSQELKTCPECRGSLRSINRYGRIVRRALLDEGAKKLTAWANRTHHDLSERLANDQCRLLDSLEMARKPSQNVKLTNSIDDQLREVKRLKYSKRYRQTFAIRTAVKNFSDRLIVDEQPYQRVRDLVETRRRQQLASSSATDIAEFSFASEELQLHEHLQAMLLLVRTEIVILSDVIAMHDKADGPVKGILKLQFDANRLQCTELAEEAARTVNVRQEVEAHIFWAKFAAMECGTSMATEEEGDADVSDYLERLRDKAITHLDTAEAICKRFTANEPDPTSDLSDELAEVRRMLDEGISSSEMRMVVAAMAKEFRGTGHWYRCVNGHPFTVGECGMPMQLARCPTCGEGIGGQHHRPTAGVQHANDIEERFGRMAI